VLFTISGTHVSHDINMLYFQTQIALKISNLLLKVRNDNIVKTVCDGAKL